MLGSLREGNGTAESPRKNFRSGLSTEVALLALCPPQRPWGESLQEPQRVLLCQWGHETGSEPTYSRARKPVTHCCVEIHLAETAVDDRHFFGILGGA